jgi:hypothetical protein
MKKLAGVVAAVAIVLAAKVWLGRDRPVVAPAQAPPSVSAPHDRVPAAAPEPVPATSPASRKLAELRGMSPTFLGSTLLIAIRDAGFVCDDVVGVEQIDPDSSAWRARCRDLMAYIVRVTGSGALAVEPTLDYFDAIAPSRPIPDAPPPDVTGPRNPRR